MLSQMVAATEGGVEKIISFVMCGLFEKPGSQYQLGQPYWSVKGYEDYVSWLRGDEYWITAGNYMRTESGTPKEDPSDKGWKRYRSGLNELIIESGDMFAALDVLMLNSRKDGIVPPGKLYLFTSEDREKWSLLQIKDTPVWDNTNHDAFVDLVMFDNFPSAPGRYLKLSFVSDKDVYLDYIVKNK
jgi:hypothetical protein